MINEVWNINERIHPDLAECLAALPKINITTETLQALQGTFRPPILPTDENINVHDEFTASGQRIRIYTPKTDRKTYPALLWIHGGGHILGLPEQDEDLILKIAKNIGCIVAAPDYRLSPEFPYPADIDDCFEAFKWLRENLPVIPEKIAIAGQSAGGGLAAALALRLRDCGDNSVCFQMPLYPMLDYRTNTPSMNQIQDYRVWNKDFSVTAWKMYLADIGENVPYYASPALAEDLSNLPPAYIMVGQLDPFRDETITYAQRLLDAGVPVELHVIPGGFHGFENSLKDAPVSKRAINEYINALSQAFAENH